MRFECVSAYFLFLCRVGSASHFKRYIVSFTLLSFLSLCSLVNSHSYRLNCKSPCIRRLSAFSFALLHPLSITQSHSNRIPSQISAHRPEPRCTIRSQCASPSPCRRSTTLSSKSNFFREDANQFPQPPLTYINPTGESSTYRSVCSSQPSPRSSPVLSSTSRLELLVELFVQHVQHSDSYSTARSARAHARMIAHQR